MDVSNDDNVAAKASKGTAIKTTWMEDTDKGSWYQDEKFVDFGNGFIFCSSEIGANSSWDDVSYEELATHAGVLFAKFQSKRIFVQAGYQTASSDGNSQKEIETGAANANACDLNWDKSMQKALDQKLTGVSSQIGQALYSNMSVSLHIRPFTQLMKQWTNFTTKRDGRRWSEEMWEIQDVWQWFHIF